MDQSNRTCEMPKSGYVLIMTARGAVVNKAQPVPFLKMHVQQALVCTIKANPALRKCQEGVVILKIWTKDHDSGIKTVRPPDIWNGRKMGIEREKLIRSPKCHNIGINIDDLLILSLSPELDFRKCRN